MCSPKSIVRHTECWTTKVTKHRCVLVFTCSFFPIASVTSHHILDTSLFLYLHFSLVLCKGKLSFYTTGNHSSLCVFAWALLSSISRKTCGQPLQRNGVEVCVFSWFFLPALEVEVSGQSTRTLQWNVMAAACVFSWVVLPGWVWWPYGMGIAKQLCRTANTKR